MNKEEFIRIAEKVSDGSATKDDLGKFNRYYRQYQHEHPNWEKLDPSVQANIGQVLKHRIDQQLKPSLSLSKRALPWARYAAAAAVLLILSFGSYFYLHRHDLQPKNLANKSQDIAPGGNKAFLTLTNGRKIILDNARDADLVEQSGIKITKTSTGELIYEVRSASHATGTNVIETPVGGEYRVRLPDGTQVWLNASSSMRYPLQFSGKKRVVEVKGEAYFEVAHNAAMPFVVKTNKQEIQVLGTHFNVMAYADEAAVQTTLLEGSVKVTTSANSLLLSPGQQSEVYQNAASLNVNADIESAVAWKAGKIQFSDMNIQNIMRMLARWYDFEIEYHGKPINTTFGGSFSRTKNLSVILKALQSTGDIHFIIVQGDAPGEGRRVIVMP